LHEWVDSAHPSPADGALKIELHGDLATLAGFAQTQERKDKNAASIDEAAHSGLLVAGIGFEPMTFRL
jgi:hypothetical protein